MIENSISHAAAPVPVIFRVRHGSRIESGMTEIRHCGLDPQSISPPRAGTCFGWFHPAHGARRGVGLLLCRPMGYEALCSYRTYTQLAHMLADAGFDVLRFDYHGTGDSAGGDADPDRVGAWLDSISCAAAELKRFAGVTRVSLFGMRLGATLAAHAAVQMGGVDSLVLWAPCATGRAFAREMRAASASPQGDVEALGALYTEETLAQLNRLDCTQLDRAPASRVLIIGRDDMPSEGPLPAHYRQLGVDTTFVAWPGYAGMMAEPHEAVLESGTLELIVQWLSASTGLQLHGEPRAQGPAWPEGHVFEGVRETPLAFGADRSLFGILSESSDARGQDRHCESAVIMLNVGGNYRIGPNRNYVKLSRALAASGYRALRMDLAGVGDSRSEAGFSSRSMYRKRSIADVRAAIDALTARGCRRFYLMGICSGSYVAFQTALADPRVDGQILMNSRLLEWREDQDGSWQTSMQQYYKSTGFYRRALLQSALYPRLLRGEVNVTGIAKRIVTLWQARLQRLVNAWLIRKRADDDVLVEMKRLGARGTDTLMVMSSEDDGLDYVEFHLGRRGAFLRGLPHFRMVMVEDADHTFSTVASQRIVIDTVLDHLDGLHERPAAWPSMPERVPAPT